MNPSNSEWKIICCKTVSINLANKENIKSKTWKKQSISWKLRINDSLHLRENGSLHLEVNGSLHLRENDSLHIREHYSLHHTKSPCQPPYPKRPPLLLSQDRLPSMVLTTSVQASWLRYPFRAVVGLALAGECGNTISWAVPRGTKGTITLMTFHAQFKCDQNNIKFLFMISLQNFAHTTTAQLSWHVQNFVVIH